MSYLDMLQNEMPVNDMFDALIRYDNHNKNYDYLVSNTFKNIKEQQSFKYAVKDKYNQFQQQNMMQPMVGGFKMPIPSRINFGRRF